MIPDREPQDAIQQAVGLYYRGYICPAEFWFQIARLLTPETTYEILEALPKETRDQLRNVYFDRPSLPGEKALEAVCTQLVHWCEYGLV